MITKITGTIVRVDREYLTLEIEAMHYEILISEMVRRQLAGSTGKELSLFTVHYLEGNPMQGRMKPRLVGFLTEAEREFFDLFCSVDGVGFRKALRAVVRPVREIARAIEDQDVKTLSTLPGIGEATSERIIAKLRRKVPKFALMVDHKTPEKEVHADRTIVEDVYQALLSVGNAPESAKRMVDDALATEKTFKNFQALMEEVYHQQNAS